ncbi:hypothetical protein Tco_1316428 [Tanacetum coccineum]
MLISWQCKKHTIVANSTTEAEYVAAANCCGQVLWIQNQMLDYGFNFMNTKIYIDNESTICIVKNLVIKIHTDQNVVDLLTKAFNVSRFNFWLLALDYLISEDVFVRVMIDEDLVLLGKINDVKQIHATVDGKTVVISESSVRSDLHFNDEDGITCLTNDAIFENLALMGSKSTSWNEFSTNIASAVICLANGQKFNFSKLIFDEPFNDVYQTPAHTKKVFTNMKRKGKDFSGRVTLLFASMLAPPVVKGEGLGQPSKPQPAPSITQPRIEEQISVTESSSPQNTQLPRQALQEDTQLPQTSMTIPNVADEAVFKEKLVQVTDPGVNTPRSNEERIEQHELMDNVPPTPHDLYLSGGHTPRSDEGRPNINELMAICTNLSNKVLALEQSKTTQDLVIQKLKKKFKRLGKKLRERTLGMKLFKIGTSKRKSLDKENGRNTVEQITIAGDTINTASIDVSAAGPSNVSTAEPSISTAEDIFKDEMMTIADTLLFKEEQAQFEREQRIAREKVAEQEANDAALIEQMEDIQARIDADELLAERLQQEEREQFTIEEKSRLLVEMIAERKREQKWINDFVPMDSELEVQRLKRAGQEVLEEPVKRQKIGEASGSGEEQSAEKEKELSEEELQKLLVVVPVEEVYVEALQVKYPIIDWEVYSKDTRRYWEIIRVGNHTEAYQIFAEILKKFNRDDLVKL